MLKLLFENIQLRQNNIYFQQDTLQMYASEFSCAITIWNVTYMYEIVLY